MRAVKKSKGRIVPVFMVSCSNPHCNVFRQLQNCTMPGMVARIVSDGWGESADGWLCPECFAKVSGDEKELFPNMDALDMRQLRNYVQEVESHIAEAKLNEQPERLPGLMKRRNLLAGEITRRNFENDKAFLIDNS